MRRTQRGASGLFVAVLLILIAAAALAILALSRTNSQIDRSRLALDRMALLQNALQQFVVANGRLPCPANPTAATGDELPAAPAAVCTHPQGTVPWKTLGVRPDDALDAWAQKISYRVYSGPTGFTQADGASMVNCVTTGVANGADATTGLCKTTKDTAEPEFLLNKGLTITNFGTVVSDAAYVLVSHGASGLGAYTADGVQHTPLPASDHESKNLLAAGPFFAEAASGQGVGPSDATHFDDILAFARIDELIRKAGRGGRSWGSTAGLSNVQLSAANVSAALGSPVSPGDLGTNTLSFAAAGVTVTSTGPSSPNLSYQESGGTGGLGVGSDGASSGSGEAFHLVFVQHAGKLALTLNDFGTGTDAVSAAYSEQVLLNFYDGPTLLGSATLGGCRPDGGLASFFVDSVSRFGAQFDTVDITPLPASGSAITPTTFFMSEVKTCDAADAFCVTSLATLSNVCI